MRRGFLSDRHLIVYFFEVARTSANGKGERTEEELGGQPGIKCEAYNSCRFKCPYQPRLTILSNGITVSL